MKTLWILLGVGAVGGAIWYFNKKGLPPLTTESQSLPPDNTVAVTTPPLVAATPEQQEAAQVVQNIHQMVDLAKGYTQPADLAPPPGLKSPSAIFQQAVSTMPDSKIKSILASKFMNS